MGFTKCAATMAPSAVAGALGAIVAAHFVKPKICEPKKTNKKFHLKYWNGRGLMEVPRTMLALKGVEYDDGRYTTDPPYDNVKSRDEIVDTLDCNLGRMPVLTVDDSVHIGQSMAINYYIATELGMMGSSNEEAAQIIYNVFGEILKASRWAQRSASRTPSSTTCSGESPLA